MKAELYLVCGCHKEERRPVLYNLPKFCEIYPNRECSMCVCARVCVRVGVCVGGLSVFRCVLREMNNNVTHHFCPHPPLLTSPICTRGSDPLYPARTPSKKLKKNN